MSDELLQLSNLAGGIEDATRQVTGQPMMAQRLLLEYLARGVVEREGSG